MRARIHVVHLKYKSGEILAERVEWYLNDSGYGIRDVQYVYEFGDYAAYIHYIDPSEWEMEDD